MEKHYFKPIEEDPDFCQVCGKNFRNTNEHITFKNDMVHPVFSDILSAISSPLPEPPKTET